MLTIYRDPANSLRTSNLQQLPKEVIWIDLLNPTDEEKEFVEKRVDVHIPSIESLSEIESSSRLIVIAIVVPTKLLSQCLIAD